MDNEYYLQHVAFIIGRGEGSVEQTSQGWKIKYDAIELGSPYEGIGLLQWSFGRSFDILREIYVALGNNFGGTNPPSDIKNAIENNLRWDSHKWYQHNPDTEWVREFLNLDVAKNIATQKKIDDTQSYLTKINAQGVTDLRAAGFGADVGNQYGTGWGKTFGMARYTSAHNSLDSIYNFTPKTYLTRRKACYDYLKNANFSSPAPVEYSVIDIDSEGEEPDVEQEYKDNANNILGYISSLLNSVMYISGDQYINKWMTGDKWLNNCLKIETSQDFSDIDLSDYLNYVDEVIEKDNEDKNENAQEEINNSDNETINKILAKANSFADHSVPYSMTGKRDMISSGDCSSFTDICFQAGGLNIGSWSGAQYNTANKLNKVLIEGGRTNIPSIISTAKAGDLLLMTKTGTTFVSGGASHVGIIMGANQFRHQGSSYPDGVKRMGPYTDDLTYYLNTWVSKYQHFALCRFIP